VTGSNTLVVNSAKALHGKQTAARRVVEDWIQIVRGEYLEIPGLLLTRSQVQRFWGIDAALCDQVLDALTGAHFLQKTRAGGFMRAVHA